jgi:hypothetical protein
MKQADSPLGSHGYGAESITSFVQLVLTAGVSMRGAARAMGLGGEKPPHWTSGRFWLERLGYAKLTASLQSADDWAWLADHSVQIGKAKCLAILGIRLQDLPPRGECLCQEQMELISLIPRESWTRKEVDDALEAAIERCGPPRVIVDDHGVDLSGGVNLFQERHSDTVEIYDVKHKAACLLKHRLEKNSRWIEFTKQVGATRCATQQTELAFLTPPAPHTKSRFMNLENHLHWAEKILAVLDDPPTAVTDYASRKRLREKFGWLTGFRREVREWAGWQTVADTVVTFINREGLYRGITEELREELPKRYDNSSTRKLAVELTEFVAGESEKARPDERLPGSTEVLESCFAKLKVLERDQSRGGFTSLVLAFGALLIEKTADVISAALKSASTSDVLDWCRENLVPTLTSQRRAVSLACATKTG